MKHVPHPPPNLPLEGEVALAPSTSRGGLGRGWGGECGKFHNSGWRFATRVSAGFTLIEVLVVMVLMLLTLSLVPPLFSSGASGVELKAAARQLAAGLRKARSQAVTSRREAALELNVEQKYFNLGGDKKTYRLPAKVDLSLFTAESERTGEKIGSVRFFPDGSSTGGRVTLTGGKQEYRVDIDWLTGQVSISGS
ncbi:MAG: GspH/FimT family pseudopilin [Sulfuricellaceae bacterium]|nr:GspH/FimT family pseudopilin [Sulfuricellaceae bacterium]